MAKRYRVINGRLEDWIAAQPDEPRYHALISDPPYALISIVKRFGKENSAPPKPGKDGAFGRVAKGFMGQTWDGFESLADFQNHVTAWGRGLMKTLYPGAVCAFFGGSRTWHRLAVGLEDAGFEIFDVIMWLYGTGFPKGHNIEIAIEKLHGITRKPGKKRQSADDQLFAPAMRWKGYNTALRPSYEPIILCRVPRHSSYAKLAVGFGTSTLNIGGASIPVMGGDLTRPSNGDGLYKGGHKPLETSGGGQPGRYPGNVILHHSESCRLMGYEQIDNGSGSVKETPRKKAKVYKQYQTRPESEPFGIDGKETVEHWDCTPDCPIGQLNQQSGVSKSGGGKTRSAKRKADYRHEPVERVIRTDSGGASRFFYTGKAASWEKCAGLPRPSEHPTMKPIQLTEYLARLLLPPPFEDGEPRRLLVPFSGVGSEMIGGVLAGWDEVTGIELGEGYCNDAEGRLDFWSHAKTYKKAKRRYNTIKRLQQALPENQQPDEPGESQLRLL